MHIILTAFACLNLGFIISFAAPTSRLESIQLSGKTFDNEIKRGVWLVEFFSPYCHHCTHFAPIWASFIADHGPDLQRHNDVSFGQVDCVANGDLCAAQNIKGYPTLFWYEAGQQTDEYKSSRTAENLLQFVRQRLPKESSGERDNADVVVDPVVPLLVVPEPSAPRTEPKEKVAEQNLGKLRIQARKLPNEDGSVVHVDAAGLNTLIDPANANGPTFVKFYAPWCTHCKALASTWRDLGAVLKGAINVAEVDCEDAKSKEACRKHAVASYPTLIFFHEGEKLEYSGSRSLSQMSNFASKAAAVHAVRNISPFELTEVAGSHDVFFLYLYPESTPSQEPGVISSASRAMLGAVTVYKSSSLDLFSRYSLSTAHPHLLTFKGGMTEPPYLISGMPEPALKAPLMQYMRSIRLPTLAQITVENQRDYFENPGQPFTVLAVLGKGDRGAHLRKMRQASEAWQAEESLRKQLKREVAFAWVDGDEWANWARRTYNIRDLDTVAVVIMDPYAHQYYDVSSKGSPLSLKPGDITDTFKAVLSGGLKPKSSMGTMQKIGVAINRVGEAIMDRIIQRPIISICLFVIFFGVLIWAVIRTLDESSEVYGKISPNNAKRD